MFKIQQCKNKSVVHSYYLSATWKHLTVVEESKETFNLYLEHLAPIQELYFNLQVIFSLSMPNSLLLKICFRDVSTYLLVFRHRKMWRVVLLY